MNIFQQLFLQVILVGAFFGSLAGVFITLIFRGIWKLIKLLIKKIKEDK